jgi:hypothetical protein
VPVWNVFHELHSGRSRNGFGPNPLAAADIAVVVERECDEAEQRREWWRLIRAMDETWLAERSAAKEA